MTKKQFQREKTPMQPHREKSIQWYVLDAAGKTLGRFASEVAKILRGKHKPDFAPAFDNGDAVIVINADKIRVTGSKEARKIYYNYTGYIGGLRETPYRTMKEKNPEYIVTHAVKGMVPRTRLGRAQMKRLRVVVGSEHGMQAQKPIEVNV